jgi:hypothetical protein
MIKPLKDLPSPEQILLGMRSKHPESSKPQMNSCILMYIITLMHVPDQYVGETLRNPTTIEPKTPQTEDIDEYLKIPTDQGPGCPGRAQDNHQDYCTGSKRRNQLPDFSLQLEWPPRLLCGIQESPGVVCGEQVNPGRV